MVDFLMISTKSTKRGVIEIYPKFIIGNSKDLMIRGGDFYAVWLEDRGLWSTNEQDVINLIDCELDIYARENAKKFEDHVKVLHMWDAETGMIDNWHKYCQKQMRDNYSPIDEKLIFSNDVTTKEDYASKRLPYPLEKGEINAYNELMSTLYSDEERHKIEWAIGAIVTGDSKKIQKFMVLYGPPGSGKSTVLNIVQKIFEGYFTVFDADSLGSANSEFALEQFKSNPLVAICHDADLSHIEKNNRINSLVSHERMTVNEKHKSLYSTKFNTFLLIGTNKPVKITDAKSGAIRRLIDIQPTGNKLSITKYNKLMKLIDFELGHIAAYCKEVYLDDPEYYDDYKPILMMSESNDFYNFMLDSYQIFKTDNGTTLKAAWDMYKEYCDEARVPYPLTMRIFKSELRNYFRSYDERVRVNDEWLRSYFYDFKTDIFEEMNEDRSINTKKKDKLEPSIDFKEQPSLLDIFCKDCPAQYSNDAGTPSRKWSEVKTTLKDINTKEHHYLKVPENLVVVDFDICDENGEKSFERNLKEASKWPKTYAELSKSGGGIHLHYIYNGDVTQLSRIYADHIEIKIFSGNSSLRRKLTKCNNEPIATISSGLPMKGESKLINFESIKNEKALRTIIKKNLNKEYHPATKPSVDFIFKALEDAYNSGVKYDVSDMYNAIIAFAASSTNQSDYCLKLIPKMHFKSDEASEFVENNDKPIVFYDVEVFPNLFLVNWKKLGTNEKVVRMINPSSKDIESLLQYRLVGFNCRRYDNHIMYARYLGKTNLELYNISQKIINEKSGFFSEAYNMSYTDIYDYSSKKQSLKKWEIELGIHHQELGLPWDKPVPEDKWDEVAEYCDNDVISTEAVWNATQADFIAREILADIAGMSVNDTTNSLTTRIIFGNDKHPQLEYFDLTTEFPGYSFEKKWNPDTQKYDKSNMYMGTDLGFGGYVSAEPGMYGNVALLDIASLHPHSAIAMNVFGKYTKNFEDLVETRVLIKHKDYDAAKKMFNGKLEKYLDDPDNAKKLSGALKIAINSVYGLTSANFDNPFRDPRNENNIVALRGALFMRKLQDEVTKRGFKVAHIKTDSIKIPDATKDIIDFCMNFAKDYGYTFEHEATYERICLVNDAVYIAKVMQADEATKLYGYAPEECIKEGGTWTATGTQFAVPYVFKTCFSKENIIFKDLCETKEVKSIMYLDMNEGMLDTTKLEQELYVITNGNREPERQKELKDIIEKNHSYQFVGRVGLFCPVKDGCGGGELVKEQKKRDGSIGLDAVTGTKGQRWLESEYVLNNHLEKDIDLNYYNRLVDVAIETIEKFGDYQWFTEGDPYISPPLVDGKPDYNVSYCQIDNLFSDKTNHDYVTRWNMETQTYENIN